MRRHNDAHESCEAVSGGCAVPASRSSWSWTTGTAAWSAGSILDPGATQFPRVHGALPRRVEQPDRAVAQGGMGASDDTNPMGGRRLVNVGGSVGGAIEYPPDVASMGGSSDPVPAELLVLLALADHARDDGVCWPSIRTIAAKARVEERSRRESFAV